MDQDLFDELITAAFQGQMTIIGEFSDDETRDCQDLLTTLEGWSERAGHPIPQVILDQLTGALPIMKLYSKTGFSFNAKPTREPSMENTPTRRWVSATISIDGEKIEAHWEVNFGKRWYFDWNGKTYAVRFADQDVTRLSSEKDYLTRNPYA